MKKEHGADNNQGYSVTDKIDQLKASMTMLKKSFEDQMIRIIEETDTTAEEQEKLTKRFDDHVSKTVKEIRDDLNLQIKFEIAEELSHLGGKYQPSSGGGNGGSNPGSVISQEALTELNKKVNNLETLVLDVKKLAGTVSQLKNME